MDYRFSMTQERRTKKRAQLAGYFVHFLEGSDCYTGVLLDVSSTGLRVRICPFLSKFMTGNTVSWFQRSLIRTSKEYDIIISNDSDVSSSTADHFTLKACPRWRMEPTDMMIIGFNIVTPTARWEQFVQHVLSSPDSSHTYIPEVKG
ncbi:MAG: hypothetical protein D3910_18495 [Candidatus Electrothrix sp. ATG2]|nr:hypothetical protein [Candidatus Electrothrix sp. ATG2]